MLHGAHSVIETTVQMFYDVKALITIVILQILKTYLELVVEIQVLSLP